MKISKAGIIYNVEHEPAQTVATELENMLAKRGIPQITLYKISGKKQKPEIETDIDIAFIVGGDGTFLGSARYLAPHGIPLLGINTGRLGFLSQLKPADMEKGVDKIINNDYEIEERLMIKSEYGTALNDIVIKGGEVSRTAQLFLYINGRHVCDYLADGLIISTPTGSTAYTLSAGGPVVVPELEAFVIVPICPHSLTTRPIVIPSDEKIEVRVKINSDFIYITHDGQENLEADSTKTILITKNDYKAKLIHLKNDDNGFYSILREKLHWGISPFN
ncbi:MAG: hypothetical protein A2Y25_10810 [Candidatus Melainabacteria bacterium GWF2_37_15]|nr:MAG: hypothetical protein A2Y25_10810 [Candidatus Melainabacteria bacterium GWF2_37_15]